LDSIIFAYFLSRQFPTPPEGSQEFRAIDLCAGCGVVGLELSYYLDWIRHFDFLEIQPVFRESFEANLEITNKSNRDYQFLEAHFNALHSETLRETYDLIVANPPYFRPLEGHASPNQVRQRARFFESATPSELFRAVESGLKPGGRAYLLVRPGEPHGRDLETELKACLSERCEWSFPAEVRGTWVLEIRKRD